MIIKLLVTCNKMSNKITGVKKKSVAYVRENVGLTILECVVIKSF